MYILIAIIIGLAIFVFITWFKSKHESNEVIKVYTGTIGSGKTYKAVSNVLHQYRRCQWAYVFRFITRCKGKPRVYSNIPLNIGKNVDVYVLKREHLLCIEKFPDDVCPIVLLDEIGLIANQYSYDDPNVVSRNINENWQTLDTFVRFFRHFYGANNQDRCRVFMTDQAVGGVNISIRRRLGLMYYLYDFHRFCGILPYYQVSCKEMILEEDTINTNDVDLKDKDRLYFFGKLPYRWIQRLFRRIPHYDSHAFSDAIESGFVSKLEFDIWPQSKSLKTNYCPDIRMSDNERIEHKKLKKKLGLISIYGINKT